MKKHVFTGDWEDALLLQFFQPNQTLETAYICSPLHAEDPDQFLFNLYAARAYMYYAKEYMGYTARAPHAYLPLLLSDDIPDERNLALRFGSELLERSHVLLVCGDRMSPGMRAEIVQATALRKKILVFDRGLYHEVAKIVRSNRPPTYSAVFTDGHPVMAHPQPQMVFSKAI